MVTITTLIFQELLQTKIRFYLNCSTGTYHITGQKGRCAYGDILNVAYLTSNKTVKNKLFTITELIFGTACCLPGL